MVLRHYAHCPVSNEENYTNANTNWNAILLPRDTFPMTLVYKRTELELTKSCFSIQRYVCNSGSVWQGEGLPMTKFRHSRPSWTRRNDEIADLRTRPWQHEQLHQLFQTYGKQPERHANSEGGYLLVCGASELTKAWTVWRWRCRNSVNLHS